MPERRNLQYDNQLTRRYEMSSVQKIIEVVISTKSTEPFAGIIQVVTVDAEIKFEITEDLAHKLCTDLDRLLTR